MTSPFAFEDTFVLSERLQQMDHRWHHCFYLSGGYVLAALALRSWMHKRPPWDLRLALVIWNVALAAFSALALWRFAPAMVGLLSERGLRYTICHVDMLQHPVASGFWCWAFIMSKVVEFGDTVFLVLRKRPLTFLHVFHHMITLIGCWYGYAHRLGLGRWLVLMNLAVHAVMYSYYALRAAGFHGPSAIRPFITSAQIAQMGVGLALSLLTVAYLAEDKPCTGNIAGAGLCACVYIAFLVLFVRFFRHAYVKKGRRPSSKAD